MVVVYPCNLHPVPLGGQRGGLAQPKRSPEQWSVVELQNTNADPDTGGYFYTTNPLHSVTLPNLPPDLFNDTFPVPRPMQMGIGNTKYPVGHYALAETEAPAGYNRNMNQVYFNVTGNTLSDPAAQTNGMQLVNNHGGDQVIEDNIFITIPIRHNWFW